MRLRSEKREEAGGGREGRGLYLRGQEYEGSLHNSDSSVTVHSMHFCNAYCQHHLPLAQSKRWQEDVVTADSDTSVCDSAEDRSRS